MAASLSKPLRLRLRGGGHRLLPSRPSTSHASQPPPPPSALHFPRAPATFAAISSSSFRRHTATPRVREGGERVVQALPLRPRRHHLRPRHMAALPEAGEGHSTTAHPLLTPPCLANMEPIAWNDVSSSAAMHDPAALEFRKIVCEGDFDEEKAVFVGPRSRSISGVTENGYYVITPLIPLSTETGSHLSL